MYLQTESIRQGCHNRQWKPSFGRLLQAPHIKRLPNQNAQEKITGLLLWCLLARHVNFSNIAVFGQHIRARRRLWWIQACRYAASPFQMWPADTRGAFTQPGNNVRYSDLCCHRERQPHQGTTQRASNCGNDLLSTPNGESCQCNALVIVYCCPSQRVEQLLEAPWITNFQQGMWMSNTIPEGNTGCFNWGCLWATWRYSRPW